MKLIEISKGVSINIDTVEAVVKNDKMNCTIYTNSNKYKSTLPYDTLIQIVLQGGSEGRQMLNIMKQMGTPAL